MGDYLRSENQSTKSLICWVCVWKAPGRSEGAATELRQSSGRAATTTFGGQGNQGAAALKDQRGNLTTYPYADISV